MKFNITKILSSALIIIAVILIVIVTTLLTTKEAHGETVGCMVICEVPEEPIRYTIPKFKGKSYFHLKEGQIIYQEIEGQTNDGRCLQRIKTSLF